MNARTATILTVLLVASTLVPGLGQAQGALAANAGPDKTIDTGQSTTFDGSASAGAIASYSWNFGDGTGSSSVSASKSYTASGTYTVTLTVVGSDGTLSSDAATVTVRTTDSTAPNLTHTAVTTGTSNSEISVSATVTDNIGVQTVTLYYKRSTDTTYNSSTMTCTGGATSKSCSGSIPASVTDGTAINYYVHATDTKTPTANTNTYPANAPTANLTVALTDTAAPGISHSVPSSATAGQSLTLTSTITDAVGVNSATLNYRVGTNGSFPGTFTAASMSRSAGTALNGTWSSSITLPSTATALQYYVSANDSSNNNATSPANAPGSNHTLGITSALAPTITVTSSPSTATPGTAATITASISAATGRGIAAVTLGYRAAATGDFTIVAMTNSSTPNTYTGTVPGAAIGDRGFDWYVRANDTASDYAQSPSAGATSPTTVTAPPGVPTGVSATRLSTGVSLSWTAPSTSATDTVANYRIYRAIPGGSSSLLGTSTTASHLDSVANAGTAYEYTVSAVDAFGTEGAQTAAATALGLAAPTVTITVGQQSLSISWDAVTGAAYYLAEIGTTNGTFTTASTNTTGTTASAAGLAGGVVHFARVTPYTALHAAGLSAHVSATPTAPAAPAPPAPAPTASFTLADLQVPAVMVAGQAASVSATLRNAGTAAGETTASLMVDSVAIANTTTTLAAGASTTVSFTYTPGEAGSHRVWIRTTTGQSLPDITVSVTPAPIVNETPTDNETSEPTPTDNETATNETPAMASFSIANLVTPDLQAGKPATITADVTNDGEAAGDAVATLVVGAVPVGTASVALAPGETRTVSVTFTPPSAGTFEVLLRLATGQTLGPRSITIAPAEEVEPTPTPTPTTTTTTTAPPPTEQTPTPTPAPTAETPGIGLVGVSIGVLAAVYLFRRR